MAKTSRIARAIVTITSFLLTTAAAQLTIPSSIPSVEDNWSLIASANGDPLNPHRLKVEDQQIDFRGFDNCNGFFVLDHPGSVNGLTFYFDRTQGTINSDHAGKTLTLSLAASGKNTTNEDFGQPVVMACDDGNSGFETTLTALGPELSLQGTGQFYVCPTRINGKEAAQVFFGPDETYLPDGCLDIVLRPKCARGPNRGSKNLGYCCLDVLNGECWMGGPW